MRSTLLGRLLLALFVIGTLAAPTATQAPTLTADQRKDLVIAEQAAELALARFQLAQVQFERARDAFQQQVKALTTAEARPEKVDGVWQLVPSK